MAQINSYGNNIDVMIEAKHKELAVKKYRELHIDNKGIYIGLKRTESDRTMNFV